LDDECAIHSFHDRNFTHFSFAGLYGLFRHYHSDFSPYETVRRRQTALGARPASSVRGLHRSGFDQQREIKCCHPLDDSWETGQKHSFCACGACFNHDVRQENCMVSNRFRRTSQFNYPAPVGYH